MGAQYDALRAVAQQTADQGREQAVLGDIHALIDEIQAKAESFTANPGMTGQTATAALNWLAEYQAEVSEQQQMLRTIAERESLASNAVQQAQAQFRQLSPDLLSSYETNVLAKQDEVTLRSGEVVSGQEYVNSLAAQREQQREEASKRILTTLNAEAELQGRLVYVEIPREQGVPDGGAGMPRSAAAGPTAGSGGSPATRPSAVPSLGQWPGTWGADLVTPAIDSSSGGSASPSNSASITVDPVLIPNGPVGGYTPPSVLDVDDPMWSGGAALPGGGGRGESGAIVGGVLGMGGALAARSATSAGLTGSSALSLRAASGSGSTVGLNSLGASSAGAATRATGRAPGGGLVSRGAALNTASATNRTTATNLASRSASGTSAQAVAHSQAAAGSSGAGKGTAGRGPGADTNAVGRNAAVGVARSEHDRKRREREQVSLVGYEVDRLDDDLPDEPIDHWAAGAGSAGQLTPLAIEDGERW